MYKVIFIVTIIFFGFSLRAPAQSKEASEKKGLTNVPTSKKIPVKSTSPENTFSIKNANQFIHTGLDIKAKIGDPVHAIESGLVVLAADNIRGHGTTIYIQHRGGIQTRYSHLTPSHQGGLKVKAGDSVKKGGLIGLVGKTGNAADKDVTEHLHLEVRKISDGYPGNPDNSSLNPLTFISQ